MTLSRISPSMPFRAAASLWIESRSFRATPGAVSARYIRENTERSYRQYIKSLELFFEDTPLEKIHLGHLSEYQAARVSGSKPFIRKRRPNKNVEPGPCPASPKKCNQELSILKMIMRRGSSWTPDMDEFYEPFLEGFNEVTRALTQDERRRWLDVCMLKPRWNLIYWYSVLAFETSMGTNEIRSLRIGDVNLHHRTVSVPPEGSKNHARMRSIPLISGDAMWAAEQLLIRAKDLGCESQIHYLFPWRKPPFPFVPNRAMTVSGIRKLWDEVREASGLKDFTPYHTRHTALTHWAEGGMRIEEMMALAGHLSPKMTRHYARISEGALRRALEAASPRKGPRSVYPSYESKRTG